VEEEEEEKKEEWRRRGAGYSCYQPVLTVLKWAPNYIIIKIQ